MLFYDCQEKFKTVAPTLRWKIHKTSAHLLQRQGRSRHCSEFFHSL